MRWRRFPALVTILVLCVSLNGKAESARRLTAAEKQEVHRQLVVQQRQYAEREKLELKAVLARLGAQDRAQLLRFMNALEVRPWAVDFQGIEQGIELLHRLKARRALLSLVRPRDYIEVAVAWKIVRECMDVMTVDELVPMYKAAEAFAPPIVMFDGKRYELNLEWDYEKEHRYHALRTNLLVHAARIMQVRDSEMRGARREDVRVAWVERVRAAKVPANISRYFEELSRRSYQLDLYPGEKVRF